VINSFCRRTFGLGNRQHQQMAIRYKGSGDSGDQVECLLIFWSNVGSLIFGGFCLT